MSHFIRDYDGNYHEFSDEEYDDLLLQEQLDNRCSAGCTTMLCGLVLSSIFGYLNPHPYIWLAGIAVTIIGALIVKTCSSKKAFIFSIIMSILAYIGAYWLVGQLPPL